jgi:spore coat protein CotH
MIYAMKYLRGVYKTFDKGCYDRASVQMWEKEIREILKKRRKDASGDWKKLGKKISGREIEDFDIGKYQDEYISTAKADRDSTFLGKFFLAAMTQKSMVTDKIFKSGNLLAGFSIDYHKSGFRGIRDYLILVEQERKKKAE